MLQADLFGAARKLFQGSRAKTSIRASDGSKMVVKLDDNCVITLTLANAGEGFFSRSLPELGVLSEEDEERVLSLRQALSRIGPAARDLSSIVDIASQRALTDQEASAVLKEYWEGVTSAQAFIKNKVDNGVARIADFMPMSDDYFSLFCGPFPGDVEPETYLRGVLPDYRQQLLRRDLCRGLEICLLGAWRDDLCPGSWLHALGDGEVWECLQSAQPELDPISMIAALDIALYRLHDGRFRGFVERCVPALLASVTDASEEVSTCDILEVLGGFLYNRLNLRQGWAGYPPYWKKLCSWMQATFLVRLLRPEVVDLKSLPQVVLGTLRPAGEYGRFADLRKEPRITSSGFIRGGLRAEILGRLHALVVRHEDEGRRAQENSIIIQAIEQSSSDGAAMDWALPGPLEGSLAQRDPPSSFTRAQRHYLLHEKPLENRAVWLAKYGQIYLLEPDMRLAIVRDIEVLADKGVDMELVDRLFALYQFASVAAVGRDGELAGFIVRALRRVAPDVDSPTIAIAVRICMVAAAAFEDERSWSAELRDSLIGLASAVPGGKVAETLYWELQALKEVMPLDLCTTRKAEALAIAGFY